MIDNNYKRICVGDLILSLPTAFSSLFLLLSLLLTACHSGQSSGKMVFRVNRDDGISSLDPAFAKNQAIMWPCISCMAPWWSRTARW